MCLWKGNFPRLWEHFKKDPFQFHSLHRPAKLECTEKAKSRDYQCPLHSTATWIPVACSAGDQGDLATEESNGQQRCHGPYAAFTGFCPLAFMFMDASHLSPSRFANSCPPSLPCWSLGPAGAASPGLCSYARAGHQPDPTAEPLLLCERPGLAPLALHSHIPI